MKFDIFSLVLIFLAIPPSLFLWRWIAGLLGGLPFPGSEKIGAGLGAIV